MKKESFKNKAKRHQLNFFSKENQSTVKEKNGRAQDHWLNEKAAGEGKIFYPGYEVCIAAKDKLRGKKIIPEWFYDTLRSQHIPFNFFIPLRAEKELAAKVFGRMLDIRIKSIEEIEIEFPPSNDNPLNDKTSFDAFVSYNNESGRKGMIGIEVKYTEGGYSPTKRERSEIGKSNALYYKKHEESKLFKNIDPKDIKKNRFRQIWRNHLLAYAYQRKNDYAEFKSVTIYPSGNTHFCEAIEEYKAFLTDAGKNTFKGITYESFFDELAKCSQTQDQHNWIEYLRERYLISDCSNQLKKVSE